MKIVTISAIASLLTVLTLPGSALEPKLSCQALETWAAELRQLPTGYEEFSALSTGERKAVYGRLSSAQRAVLWQRHWQEALAAGGLTAEQQALVEEAGRLMHADTFAALKPRQGALYDSAMAAVRDFEARVKKAFPRAVAATLFYRLGTAPAEAPEAAGKFSFCDCSPGGEEYGTSLCWPSSCPFRPPAAASSTKSPVPDSANINVCRKKRRVPLL